MNAKPEKNAGDWVWIGTPKDGFNAVVSLVRDDSIEAVYLEKDGDRALNEDFIWDGDKWTFKIDGPCAGYADNFERLVPFVAKLRSMAF
jgi:hypothetical protein